MVKWQKIKRLNHFLKNSFGGAKHGFSIDFTPFFQIYGLFTFRHSSEKWTFGLKFGLLEAEKSKLQTSVLKQVINRSFLILEYTVSPPV